MRLLKLVTASVLHMVSLTFAEEEAVHHHSLNNNGIRGGDGIGEQRYLQEDTEVPTSLPTSYFPTSSSSSYFPTPDTGGSPTPVPKNIVEVAEDDPSNFSTLITALETAGLVDTLSGEGPFTVFAPTNEAFDKLDQDVLASLLQPKNKDQLVAILTYHVIAGAAIQSTDLSNGQEVETLNGDTIQVTLSDDGVKINDASVTTPDIPASNGVIHMIDMVLMPPTPEPTNAPSMAPSKPPSSSPTPAPKNIVEIASADNTFSTLVAALGAADLVDTLSSEGPFTVFAPTDEAFAKLPQGTVDSLLQPENKDQLVTILTYHAVSGAVRSTDLSNGPVQTLNGETVQVDTDNGVTINDATVTLPDIEASNGIIHVIDTVLLPPTPQPTDAPNPSPPTIAEGVGGSGIEPSEGTGSSVSKTSEEKTIVEIASADTDNFSTLVTALGTAGLADTLSGDGPLTVFAPTEEAFSKLPAGTVESLLQPENKDQLVAILTYHVIAGAAIQSTDLSNGQEIKTLNGDTVHVSVSRAIMKQRKKMKRGVVPYMSDTTGIKINNANVIKADIRALNGIVHVIDEVLLPGEYTKSGHGGGSMHGGYSKSSKRGKTSKSAKRSKTSKSAKVSKSAKAVIIHAKSSKKGKSKGKK